MITIVLVLVLSLGGVAFLINRYRDRLRHPVGTFYGLFGFHTLFFIVYYLYALASASDSFAYYYDATTGRRGETWLEYYGVGTVFIEFITYPFANYFGFSYEAVMLLFSFFGFVGFFYFYLFITESTAFRHKLWGIDLILLLLFLPNMHFWTVSLGKGSIVFMGLGIFFYGLARTNQRWLALVFGALILFHVRAHVLSLCLVGLLASLLFTSKGLSITQKMVIISLGIAAIIPSFNTFLEYAGLEEAGGEGYEEFIQHRSGDLAKATSGVDIQNYNQLEKLFAFWFRPLFFDAPNALGLIVSFENLFYLLLVLKIASLRFIRYLIGADWMVKTAFASFFLISVAIAQIFGNLGLALRQKSMVMYLLFFVILAYADWAYRTKGEVVIGE